MPLSMILSFHCRKHTHSVTHRFLLWKWTILEFILAEMHWKCIKCITKVWTSLAWKIGVKLGGECLFTLRPLFWSDYHSLPIIFLNICCIVIRKHPHLHVVHGCSELLAKPGDIAQMLNDMHPQVFCFYFIGHLWRDGFWVWLVIYVQIQQLLAFSTQMNLILTY